MYFRQFYLGCLAHASYLIGSRGEAAVVDPQRDVDQYISEAEARGLRIRYVVETHLHADFVSGHRELADRTGAGIVFGKRAQVQFPHRGVSDGDELEVGGLILRVLETPGHTPESISILVIDPEASPNPQKVLTGDTLFIGDVGRPDLVGSKGYTPEQMAGMLYSSLHEKLLVLDDAVEVYPAHGAGSLCGRNMARETSSTIGEQRQFNYALKPMSREAFVRMMTADLPEAPAYFPADAEINRTGAAPVSALAGTKALDPRQVRRLSEEDALVLDVRAVPAYGTGHVPGSLNIGLGGEFASWAGTLIPMGSPIVIVADDEGSVTEAVLRLARVGLDSVEGYLSGGIQAWDAAGLPLATLPQMPIDELANRIEEGVGMQILDVRRQPEYSPGHVPGAVNVPLAELPQRADGFDRSTPVVAVCGSGYRSSMATSLLERAGFREVYNLVGGTTAWLASGHPGETSGVSEGASS
jgi:hydroxyacylglutathione hydrolase